MWLIFNLIKSAQNRDRSCWVTGVGVASELASWPEQGAEMPASMQNWLYRLLGELDLYPQKQIHLKSSSGWSMTMFFSLPQHDQTAMRCARTPWGPAHQAGSEFVYFFAENTKITPKSLYSTN
jgi:hypothetical protein